MLFLRGLCNDNLINYLSSQFLPTWLAPNLITFTGFMFLVLNFLMLAFFDFDFTASGMSKLPVYLIFLHTKHWPNPPNGVKLPAVFHKYKVKAISGNDLPIAA